MPHSKKKTIPSHTLELSLTHTVAEVQMVCLCASLTQRCSLTSSLLYNPFLTLSVKAPPHTPLSLALLSLCPLSSSVFSNPHLSPRPLLVVLSGFRLSICFLSAASALLALASACPDEWVIFSHCTLPALSVFPDGSFDARPPVFGGQLEPRR